jgi:DNA-binding NarL/FixJ family response regulator
MSGHFNPPLPTSNASTPNAALSLSRLERSWTRSTSANSSRASGTSTTMSERKAREVVLVVDDSPETLRMLTDALDQAGMTVMVALDGSAAMKVVEQITPDIILLDAVMPGFDGFEACRRLKSEPALSHVPVVFMTGLSETEHIVRGLEAGGVDYVTKPIVIEEMLARIRVHLANARLIRRATEGVSTAHELRKDFKLTSREVEVLSWLSKGKTNRDIAQILGLSPRTIDKHLEQIYAKLGVENRTAAAAMAVKTNQDRES